MTQNREEEQTNGIEDKHCCHCHGHVGVFGFDDRTYSSNGTTATDGCARTDEVGGVAVDFQYFATDKHADEQSANDGYNRKEHTLFTRSERGLEIHSKAQTDDGVLEEFFRYIFIKSRVGLSTEQCKHESNEKHYGRGDPHSEKTECRDIITEQTQCEHG